ncbi:hypothetical protein K443DRAFT_677442 [Laccaria amethystina LaAM-08-1]|uniref:Uncharacterized protein n=1 Tax=Laccaria amethystina LaAM-08-1 TaxID=1095629 RepID=A0A0C9XCJ7_9AGAR|nr:hypothetical protein K443DRAFT_677442 [Laccaria amethystina LaAM-08-1]
MPALEITSRAVDFHPALGHVNLMVDTFIANASVEDLRSIVRNLLATGPPGIAPAFTNSARSRLTQTSAKAMGSAFAFFDHQPPTGSIAPTQHLYNTLTRVRLLYGAGMGFTSLGLLASIVRATLGLQWEEDDVMEDILAIVDADIGQAIQSCKEEIDGGRVGDIASAREAVHDLRCAVNSSMADVKAWGGEFPFERASASIQYWKV